MLPDLISLALFVRVAETRSITKAAEASHIALAAATRRLSLLEHHYGVKLLDRTARGAELTAAGKPLVHRARPILSQVDQLARLRFRDPGKSDRDHALARRSGGAGAQAAPGTDPSPQLRRPVQDNRSGSGDRSAAGGSRQALRGRHAAAPAQAERSLDQAPHGCLRSRLRAVAVDRTQTGRSFDRREGKRCANGSSRAAKPGLTDLGFRALLGLRQTIRLC